MLTYVAKLSSAIQIALFGASQMQITRLTSVNYVDPYGLPRTFAVSDSLHHGRPAIWTYLKPVLDDLQGQHPAVDVLDSLETVRRHNRDRKAIFISSVRYCKNEEFVWRHGIFKNLVTVKVCPMVMERNGTQF